jgi:hypothetical protein
MTISTIREVGDVCLTTLTNLSKSVRNAKSKRDSMKGSKAFAEKLKNSFRIFTKP